MCLWRCPKGETRHEKRISDRVSVGQFNVRYSILFEMFGGTGYTTNYLIHGLMGMIAGYFYKRGSEGNGSEQTKA